MSFKWIGKLYKRIRNCLRISFACIAVGSIILNVKAEDFGHWALKFSLSYTDIVNVSELDEYMLSTEFYEILDAHTGNETPRLDSEFITREEACAVLAKYLPKISGSYAFTDRAEISESIALEALCALGLIDGYPDGSFRPHTILTRGEGYKILSRFSQVCETIQSSADNSRIPENMNVRRAAGRSVIKDTDEIDDTRPDMSFTAAMGKRFRSIDITISYVSNASTVFYAIVESGSHQPNKSEIMSGSLRSSGKLSDLSSHETALRFSVDGENGLIDGYNYDIYMLATDETGRVSDMTSVKSVMAMPFSDSDYDERRFMLDSLSVDEIDRYYPDLSQNSESGAFYQTARQLANIQRLAELYSSSSGIHGSEDFLTGGYTYILSEDMDLSHYMSYGNETGWKPIGTKIPFSGAFDGNGKTISGLYIDLNMNSDGAMHEYAGLFGRIRDAYIRGLTLDSPIITLRSASRDELYTCVGAIAAESVRSSFEQLNVKYPKISVYSADVDSMSAVGGVVGNCVNTGLTNISVTNAELSNNGLGLRDLAGGIVGRYYLNREGTYLLEDLFVSGALTQDGKAAGGIAGVIDAVSDAEIYLSGKNIDSTIRITGHSAYVGGIAGNVGYEALLGKKAVIGFDNCYASGMVKGSESVGGLFGKVNSMAKSGFVVKNSASEADIVASTDIAVLGGFAGEVHSASFENCHSLGSGITASDAGGFVGISRGDSNFINCIANRNVQAALSAGGFIGRKDGGSARFYNCSTGGRVSGANAVGDFAGTIVDSKSVAEIVDCSIKTISSSGRIVGAWKRP